MKAMKKFLCLALALCLICGLAAGASASTFTDAHGNVIELDDSLEAYTEQALYGADDAARKGETNLGDLWADALRWFAVSGKINEFFEEDDVTAGNTAVIVVPDSPAGETVRRIVDETFTEDFVAVAGTEDAAALREQAFDLVYAPGSSIPFIGQEGFMSFSRTDA